MKKYGGILGLFIGLFLVFSAFPGAALADGTISGTVTWAADNSAIDDIWVYAVAIDGSGSDYDQTEADGTYTITVDPGAYVVYNLVYDGDGNYYIRVESDAMTIVDGEAVIGIDFSLTRQPVITGSVYQSDGVTPINEVFIYADDVVNYVYGSGYGSSAFDGSYSFYVYSDSDYTRPAGGYYDIVYQKLGYFGVEITNIPVANQGSYNRNISLIAISHVSGTIKDSSDNAVANVLVNIANEDYTFSAITDAAGQYSIEVGSMYHLNGTAVGSYTLSAFKEGYVEGSKSIEIVSDESNLTDNNFTLSAAGTISGTVYKKNGVTTLAGVSISADDGYGNSYTTLTAADGSYSLTSCNPSTKYRIIATKDKYLSKNKYNITVEASSVATSDFNLTKGKSFSGTITSKTGAKLQGATVNLYKRDKHYSTTADYTTTSKNNGRFKITGVDPGYYRLKISLDGYVTKEISRVKLRKNKSSQTYQLAKAASIYGKVSSNGTAIRGATIYVYGTKKNADVGYASTTTDDDGYYYISDLKKGKYRIKALTTEYTYKEVVKTLKAGKQKIVNLKLTEAGAVSGYIIDADTNIPLSNYCARIKGASRYSCADSNGFYIIYGMAPGKYEIYVAEEAYNTQYYSKKDAKKDANKVQIKANETTKNINFYLDSKDD